jgi:integrase
MPVTKLRQDTVRTLRYTGIGNRQCIYWDESLPCFGIRVFPSGRRSYVCSYRVFGRFRIATLGRADALTLDQARKKARGYLGRVASSLDPQAAKDVAEASGTIKALCEEYMKRHALAKKRSWKNDESYIDRILVPKLGSRLASSVTSVDIAKIHSDVGAEHPYAANRFLEIVAKMFVLGRTWGKLPKDAANPAVGIEPFPEKKRRRYVTTAEMPKLAKAIDAEDNEFARHAIWLLLLTGVRRTELLKAKWSDIDWDLRTLYVGQTKNGEPVLAPLSNAAITQLKMIARIEENPYVICGKINGQHLKNLRPAWVRVRTAACLEDVTLHDLRRTVGSWLVREGSSLHLVGAVLNHKDPKTTAGYAYFQIGDRQAALDRHGEKIVNLAAAHRALDVAEAESADPPESSHVSKSRTRRFTRQELYELVWSQPVAELAASYGVSDVGLAKACRRANIPVPGRGYWAKVAAAQPVEKRSLPPCTSEPQNRIKIKRRLIRQPSRSLAEPRARSRLSLPAGRVCAAGRA